MLSLSCGCFILPHIAEQSTEKITSNIVIAHAVFHSLYVTKLIGFLHFNVSLFLCLFLENNILRSVHNTSTKFGEQLRV